MRSFNLCDNDGCGEVFRTYFCKKCDSFQNNLCKRCHEEYFLEIKRIKQLSRLKRSIDNV